MAAMNSKCHEKGCECASCSGICSRCLVAGRCSDDICKSEHGMQNCDLYEPYKEENQNIAHWVHTFVDAGCDDLKLTRGMIHENRT